MITIILLRNLMFAIILVAIAAKLGIYLSSYLAQVAKGTYRTVLRAILVLVFVVAFTIGGLMLYVYWGFGSQGDIVRKIDTTDKVVAITFDDGPSPAYTPQILDVLRDHDVRATFFLVGSHVEKYPDIVERIYLDGHDIGNHTFSHLNVPTAPATKLSSELMRTNLAIMQITGEYPQYLRPPRGMYDERFRRLSELMGMQIVLWSLSSQDWLPTMTAANIERRVLQNVRPGDILLFHDSGALIRSEGGSRQRTVNALAGVIEGLRDQGYRIVPLSTLLRQEPEVLESPEEWPEY